MSAKIVVVCGSGLGKSTIAACLESFYQKNNIPCRIQHPATLNEAKSMAIDAEDFKGVVLLVVPFSLPKGFVLEFGRISQFIEVSGGDDMRMEDLLKLGTAPLERIGGWPKE